MHSKKILLVFITLVLFLSACSTERKIVGKWYDEYGTEINFYEDGTFIIKTSVINFSGEYKFVDNETLVLDSEGIIGLFGSQVFIVDISNDEMYLDSGDSVITLYSEQPNFSDQSSNDSGSVALETVEENNDNVSLETPEVSSSSGVVWALDHDSSVSSLGKYGQELFYIENSSWEFEFISRELTTSSNKFVPIYPKPYAFDDKAVYITNNDDHPASYSMVDGSELWVSDIEAQVFGSGNETVFVFTSNNRIYGLDKNNGQERWKIIVDSLLSADEESDPFPIVIKSENMYYVPLSVEYKIYDYSTRFLKFNEIDGSAEVTMYNPELSRTIEPFMIQDDTLIGIDNDLIMSIDINDGSLNWVWGDNDRHDGRFYIENIYGFDQQNNILYFDYEYSGTGGYDTCTFGCLLALDLTSGTSIWDEPISVTGPEFGKQFDSFYVFDDYVYQVYYQEVFLFDKNTGDLLNSYSSERYIRAFPGEKYMLVYIPDLEIAYGIDPINNEVLWEDDEFLYKSFVYAFDNLLIYVDEDFYLVGLNLATGNHVWKFEGDFGLGARYAICDDLMVHKEWNDHLELIDLNNGSITDIYSDGGWGIQSDEHLQVIENDTWLYFGDYLALIKLK